MRDREDKKELITIKTFAELIEAEIFRAKLESKGIECWLRNVSFVGINPVRSSMAGDIRIKVKKSDLEKVEKLIQK